MKYLWLLLLAAVLIASKIPLSSEEAHHRADSVLFPRFIACWNDFAENHPSKPEHFKTFDAKDAKRWQAVRESFKELDQAMKEAGY